MWPINDLCMLILGSWGDTIMFYQYISSFLHCNRTFVNMFDRPMSLPVNTIENYCNVYATTDSLNLMHYRHIRGNLQRSQICHRKMYHETYKYSSSIYWLFFEVFSMKSATFFSPNVKGHRFIKGIVSLCKLEHIGRKFQIKKPFGETILSCQGLWP